VTIESSGEVFVYGAFSLSSNARCQVFGYLGVAGTGLLPVGSSALISP